MKGADVRSSICDGIKSVNSHGAVLHGRPLLLFAYAALTVVNVLFERIQSNASDADGKLREAYAMNSPSIPGFVASDGSRKYEFLTNTLNRRPPPAPGCLGTRRPGARGAGHPLS